MRRALACFAVLCVLGGVLTAAMVSSAGAAERQTTIGPALIVRIDHYRDVTWHWQRLMGLPLTRSAATAPRSPDLAYREWVLRLWQHRAVLVQRRALPWMTRRIAGYQATVTHWNRVMGLQASPPRALASAYGVAARERAYLSWQARATAMLRKAAHPPYASAFACIHRYEGSWTDGGAPYYGGLQMDLGFQAHYGGYLLRTKGTADHWTPTEQMWVAARAVRSGRGFYPWPNSARICGLI